MNVLKRNGEIEEFSVDKLNRVVDWACEGLEANPSDILMNAKLQVYNGMKTSKIHEVLIKSTNNLISLQNPDYQFAASKLFSFFNRKQVFGVFADSAMPTIRQVIDKNIEEGFYDPAILDKWSAEDWIEIEQIIDHSNDNKLAMAQYKKIFDSYLTRNRDSGYVYETPQYMFMMLALTMKTTVADVKSYYASLVRKEISLPTPIAAGVRTKSKQFASCTLIDIDDNLESIYASMHAVGRFVSRKAGIGLGITNWRALGDKIRNGEVIHTGVIPFLKLAQAATKSCSQGGLRDGSTTTSTLIWHPEIEDLMVLKNNKGTDDNRVKNLDYCIQVSELFWKRMLSNQVISLFSTHAAPQLLQAWGTPEFDEVYIAAEKDSSIPRKTVQGQDLLVLMAQERFGTGRLYIMNIDNVNKQNRFYDKITMTNLCTEITLPTTPIQSIDCEEGEIALCNLGGLNLGMLGGRSTFHRMETPLRHIVTSLDEVISMQEYPVKAAEKQLKRRSIGVGITNFAYWMAKNNLNYNDPAALPLIDELMEHFQFYLLKASMELAKEKGACEWFHKTKYSKGIMPYDLANEEAKKLVDRELTCDWDWLREEILQWGLRNSVVSAQMPVESSSLVTNSTNAFEPPRSLITTKTNKAGSSITMLVPDAIRLSKRYTLAWDIVDNSCINKIAAVAQKWIDQAMSVNHYYNPMMYGDNKVPTRVIIKDMVEFFKLGGKCLYYANTLDTIESDDSVGCEGGACSL